jgi:hypothetical protein
MMKFKEGKLPEDPLERYKYLCRFRELLKLYHNKKGQEMLLEEFREFQKNWFDPRNDLICEEINACLPLLKKKYYDDDKVQVDITDIEE